MSEHFWLKHHFHLFMIGSRTRLNWAFIASILVSSGASVKLQQLHALNTRRELNPMTISSQVSSSFFTLSFFLTDFSLSRAFLLFSPWKMLRHADRWKYRIIYRHVINEKYQIATWLNQVMQIDSRYFTRSDGLLRGNGWRWIELTLGA